MVQLTPEIQTAINNFNTSVNPKYKVVATHSNYSPIGVQLQVTENDLVIWVTKSLKSLADVSKTLT